MCSSDLGKDDAAIKKLDAKIKKLKAEHASYRQDIEDLQVFDNMFENDNWSMVEHLSPKSRQAAVGRGPKGHPYQDPFEGKKPNLNLKDESSYFAAFNERQATKKRAVIGKERGEKVRKFARRVFENAEARKAKREARKARKGGRVFGEGEGGNRDTGAIEKARNTKIMAVTPNIHGLCNALLNNWPDSPAAMPASV